MSMAMLAGFGAASANTNFNKGFDEEAEADDPSSSVPMSSSSSQPGAGTTTAREGIGEGRVRARSELADATASPAAAAAAAQLQTCQTLSTILASAISSLTSAGSGLQKGVLDAGFGVGPDAPTLAAHLSEKEDLVTASAVQGLLGACGSLGAVFVKLAAALTSDFLDPLDLMTQRLQAECASRREEYLHWREAEVSSSVALTESLQNRDKARASLRALIRCREQKERQKEKAAKTTSLAFGWLTRQRSLTESPSSNQTEPPSATSITSDEKVHRAALLQTETIELLARRTDEAAEARALAEKSAVDFEEALHRVHPERASVLETSLNKCADAWDEAAGSLRSSAKLLRLEASQVRQNFLFRPPSEPEWTSRGFYSSEQQQQQQQQQQHQHQTSYWAWKYGSNAGGAGAASPAEAAATTSSATTTTTGAAATAGGGEGGQCQAQGQAPTPDVHLPEAEAPPKGSPRLCLPRSPCSRSVPSETPKDGDTGSSLHNMQRTISDAEVYGVSRVFANPFDLEQDDDPPGSHTSPDMRSSSKMSVGRHASSPILPVASPSLLSNSPAQLKQRPHSFAGVVDGEAAPDLVAGAVAAAAAAQTPMPPLVPEEAFACVSEAQTETSQ